MPAGAVLVIVMIFMAVTSSGASEMLAVSSLFTFDIYRRYIKPKVGLFACIWSSYRICCAPCPFMQCCEMGYLEAPS